VGLDADTGPASCAYATAGYQRLTKIATESERNRHELDKATDNWIDRGRDTPPCEPADTQDDSRDAVGGGFFADGGGGGPHHERADGLMATTVGPTRCWPTVDEMPQNYCVARVTRSRRGLTATGRSGPLDSLDALRRAQRGHRNTRSHRRDDDAEGYSTASTEGDQVGRDTVLTLSR